MVAPEVDEATLTELEGMGFGRNRATRALHATGTTSVEQAVNWIVEHEADADLDEPLLVPKKDLKRKLTKEEARAKAEELRKSMAAKREKEEKEMERLRAQERIRLEVAVDQGEAGRSRRCPSVTSRRVASKRRRRPRPRRASRRNSRRIDARAGAAGTKTRSSPRRSGAARRREGGGEGGQGARGTGEESRGGVTRASRRRRRRLAKDARRREKNARRRRGGGGGDDVFQDAVGVPRQRDEEPGRGEVPRHQTEQRRVPKTSRRRRRDAVSRTRGVRGRRRDAPLARDKVDATLINLAGAEINNALTNPFFGVL